MWPMIAVSSLWRIILRLETLTIVQHHAKLRKELNCLLKNILGRKEHYFKNDPELRVQ